jgi:protein-tyrosine phosphatase
MKKYLVLFFLTCSFGAYAQITDSTQREVKLQGAINFRDLGGYATKDGKHVKWGKIYRSAALNHLTDSDISKLEGLSLSRVADFRGPYEVKIAEDRLPANVNRISLPAGSENIGDSNYMKQMIRQMKNDSSLIGFYSDLTPFKDRYQPVFKELLTISPDSAFLFHCTAGKDRTGIAAALILYALGVDEHTIMEDYLATNYYRRAENDKAVGMMVKAYGLDEVTARKMMGAKPEYLQATFTAIKTQYGSMNNYLEKGLGLTKSDLSQLKKAYLD